MSAAKHTPGPWGYEDPMGPDILTIVANPSDPVYEWVWVAQIGTAVIEDDDGKVIDQRPFWEHEANARLMAAAPEMLEALEAIVAAPDGCVYCDSGRLRLPPRFPHARPDQGHEASCGFAMAEAAISKATARAALKATGG